MIRLEVVVLELVHHFEIGAVGELAIAAHAVRAHVVNLVELEEVILAERVDVPIAAFQRFSAVYEDPRRTSRVAVVVVPQIAGDAQREPPSVARSLIVAVT
jgi:hypothetical protein